MKKQKEHPITWEQIYEGLLLILLIVGSVYILYLVWVGFYNTTFRGDFPLNCSASSTYSTDLENGSTTSTQVMHCYENGKSEYETSRTYYY